MNEQKNNGRGIFYGVIGIATLVVAIIGATFAYFTATAANNVITGNMARVELGLSVTKLTTRENEIGMIPMSNGMVEAAVNNYSNKGVCIDDNGNAVCQIYEITLTNSSSAGQFVDGYVALRGGSGVPQDYMSYDNGAKFTATDYKTQSNDGNGTTMRWAQVFPIVTAGDANANDTDGDGICDINGDNGLTTDTVETTYTEADCVGTSTKYSTAGNQYLGVNTVGNVTSGVAATLYSIGNASVGANTGNIRTTYAQGLIISGDTNGNGTCENTKGDDPTTTATETEYQETCTIIQNESSAGVLTNKTITGTSYPVIGANYVRVSNHIWQTDITKPESYNRTADVTSALVFNNSIEANKAAKYYIAVWLTENGKNQTASGTTTPGDGATTPAAQSFFMGNVTFISAQGSEVSASFTDYTRVQSNNAVQ